MTSSRAPDAVVVGAGIVGAVTALGLVEAGQRVLLLESDFPGSGSSGAAMGHIVAMDDTPAQLSGVYSRARWHEMAPTLSPACEDDRCGTLWLAVNDEECDGARARAAEYTRQGVRAEFVDAATIRTLEPHLAAEMVGGLRVPDDGVCYPPAIARELSERVAAKGGTVRYGTKVARLAANELQLADGTKISTGAIVIATGVASPNLVPGLPIIPRKGHLVITDRRPGLVTHQVLELGYLTSAHTFGAASIAFNVQPRRTGQMLIGSSRELVGFDASINRPLVRDMLARAARFVPAIANARALRTWVGFRPTTVDKLPLIGPWPDISGVWIATGHEGLGITMAPGTAALIVAGITGTKPPIDPVPFRPDRLMPALETDAGHGELPVRPSARLPV